MNRAITPGTFDPITLGHIEVVTRAAQIFDEVVVGVASSDKKKPLFSLDERVALAREALKHLPNVRVEPMLGLLVDFAREQEAQTVVKGLRAITDFEYEFQMSALNNQLSPDLGTIFIMSSPKYMYISSSIVREIASMGGPLDALVSPVVVDALHEKFGCGEK